MIPSLFFKMKPFLNIRAMAFGPALIVGNNLRRKGDTHGNVVFSWQ
jgi:hypothetical protein